MKCKSIVCLPFITLGLLMSSCGDKKPAESSSAAESKEKLEPELDSANPEMDDQVEQIKEIQKQQEVVPVKEEEVRDTAGFAKHLPKETEMFFNAQGVEGLIGSMRGSEIGEFIAKLAKKEGDDIDAAMNSAEFQEFLNVAGEEVFISMGDGSAKSLKTMGDMYSVYYRFYYYMIGKFMINAVDGGDMMQNPEQMMSGMFKDVFEELAKFDDYQMPSIYVGFKVSNETDRAKYTKLLQDTFEMALKFGEEVPQMKDLILLDSTESYGGFNGVKLDYSKALDSFMALPEAAQSMEMMGVSEEEMRKYVEKFKDFKLTLLVGNYGDYVVIYLGETSEKLAFIEQASESLLANEEMSFLKEYKGKEVVSVTYVSKEIYEELAEVSTMMEDLSAGVNKVLKETKSLGNTEQIQLLLKKLADGSKKLDSLTSSSRFGSVAYLEDGFKMDSFHGSDSAIYDLDAQRKLASIAMQHDAVISSSWVANEVYSKLSIQSLEDLVHLAYQATKLAAGYDTESREFLEFSDMFKMLDGQFSDHLVTIWNAVKDATQHGLGNEGAMVIDLKGTMPRVPDVPSIVLEKGKIPRLAIGYDVVDRSILASSWKQIDAANRQIVSKLEQITNQKINYRDAELAKREGIDFWSYQLGITSHEANLALGINENMMFFTTAPAFVEEFLSMYDADGKRGGMDFKLRMAPIRAFASDWIQLVDEHGDELSPSFDRAEFNESKVFIDEALKVSEEIDSVDFSMRKVNGEVRSFFHINKRN